jgi:hypothetical protein
MEPRARDRIYYAAANEVFSEMCCYDAEATLALQALLLAWVYELVELFYAFSV